MHGGIVCRGQEACRRSVPSSRSTDEERYLSTGRVRRLGGSGYRSRRMPKNHHRRRFRLPTGLASWPHPQIPPSARSPLESELADGEVMRESRSLSMRWGSQMSGSPALSGRTSGSASAEERRPTATGALAALLRLIPIPATRDLSVVLVLLLFSEFALELAGRDTHPLNHQVLPCGPSNIVLLQTRAGQGTNAPSVRRTERDLLGLRLLYPAPWGARGVRRCLRGVSPCRPAPSCSTSSG